MMPELKLGLMVGSFALFFTVHVIVVLGLFKRPQPLQGVLALVLPPVAPVFAWQRGTRIRAALWGVFAAVYIVAFLAAR